jgi:diacylglycerol kinase (ATP)
MKVAKILYNPKAGDGDTGRKELISLMEANGYKCYFASVKKEGWEEIEPDVDFIVVAGGDGTVRRVADMMLKRGLIDKRLPIAVLPMGTANNIAKSLNLTGTVEEIIKSWKKGALQPFDIGRVTGIEDQSFFLEGFGFGMFPNLMKEMKKHKDEERSADESIMLALKTLKDLGSDYKARECKLEIDGIDHSGKFLLVEIMNIASIGPNLSFNPFANHGDGELEVILIPESQREKFVQYMQDKINGVEEPFCFSALKAKDIKIAWEGIHTHIDDAIVKDKPPVKVEIEIYNGVLNFLI